MMRRIQRINKGEFRPGQDLVVAGYVGRAGTKAIAREKRDELLRWFSQDFVDGIMEEAYGTLGQHMEPWSQLGATEVEPVLEGGILAALWNLSGAYQTGIRFSLRKIPIRQDTIEVCERYGLNPYGLLSGNCVLLVGNSGAGLAEALGKSQVPTMVVGKVTEGIARLVEQGQETGYLNRPQEDELSRVIGMDGRFGLEY